MMLCYFFHGFGSSECFIFPVDTFTDVFIRMSSSLLNDSPLPALLVHMPILSSAAEVWLSCESHSCST
ncbi:hypothetical protein K443DRAFT_315796 [Laccaria amethystina LaAM-08-1]|uniref:Unplaced genomic scaffold K443scaffold_207, whole genome shotgun sequence n=1 Tax=Laccaria amethystina LaAM-08-1 TaxID=1095629 RepID=A0A0C9WK48_9AGAR|nr:hypothetical protein K443DRAFT_315796 [Laccaria amethystina LaAM-08-1]